jgi:hypothetical protein
MPGGLGREPNILTGVLKATVRDPSGRAPTPDRLTGLSPQKEPAFGGQPVPIFTPVWRHRKGQGDCLQGPQTISRIVQSRSPCRLVTCLLFRPVRTDPKPSVPVAPKVAPQKFEIRGVV